jgi:hypothetical protein
MKSDQSLELFKLDVQGQARYEREAKEKKKQYRDPQSYSLSYKPIFETSRYHIVHHKGEYQNLHEMSIESNDCNIRPFKEQSKTNKIMHFNQYMERPPINKDDLKHNRPNEKRFTIINDLPENKTGVTRLSNLRFENSLDRTNNSFLE